MGFLLTDENFQPTTMNRVADSILDNGLLGKRRLAFYNARG